MTAVFSIWIKHIMGLSAIVKKSVFVYTRCAPVALAQFVRVTVLPVLPEPGADVAQLVRATVL